MLARLQLQPVSDRRLRQHMAGLGRIVFQLLSAMMFVKHDAEASIRIAWRRGLERDADVIELGRELKARFAEL